MSIPRIQYLLNQLVEGTINSEEKDELNDLIQHPAMKDNFINVLTEGMESGLISPEWNGERLEQMVDSILSADKSPKPLITNRSKISLLRRWAAAAVILLFLFGGYYSFFHKSGKIETGITETKIKDISPGGNKATLTLGNGTKIVLDSAAKGVLAVQAGTRILKTDSGGLTYNAFTHKSEDIVLNTLTTPRGGQFQLSLPDGTKVWLNAASSITYPTAFSGKDRNVSITGEAYFEVAKDKSKPFHVTVNGMKVEVLGTHFNINAYPDEPSINTTLLEGSVRVVLQSAKMNSAKEGILKPGQQARIAGKQIGIFDKIDTDQVIAWKEGFFQFDHADLQTILRQLSRWYDIQVEYPTSIPKREFFGRLNRNLPLSSVLTILKSNNIHYVIKGDNRLIIQP